MKAVLRSSCAVTLPVIALCLSGVFDAARADPARNCPAIGWSETVTSELRLDAPFPTSDTKNDSKETPTPDCGFHQWSWEAFAWATFLVKTKDGVMPRFMTLATPEDLASKSKSAGAPGPRELKLASRPEVLRGANSIPVGAGAIVQADGHMQVAPNGYPVYASVHMNESYFNTARKNMIANHGYEKAPRDSSFDVGAAVFKATWLRIADGDKPPAGAYTTTAEVPVLQTTTKAGVVTIAPVPGKFVKVTVALVGLHVVGLTDNHPEFLWGTFEHALNSPQIADNTFTPSKGTSDPKDYTFYQAGTTFDQVNLKIIPPQLKLDEKTQKLSPVTNAVLDNKTGGENQDHGPDNIAVVNAAGQRVLAGKDKDQAVFASYNLIGTVWMLANTYNKDSNQTNAIGSVNLANVTAETFVQAANNTPIGQVLNCFLCHNATSYSFQKPPPKKLATRLIALSHVLGYGSEYAVPNQISSKPSLALRPALQ